MSGGSGPLTVVPNSVAVVDLKKGRVVADIAVGSNPISVAAGLGGIWVANAEDGTVTHIDPETRKVVKTIGMGGDISDVAVGFGSVWVANGNEGSLVRIDPELDAVERTIPLGGTDLQPLPVFDVAAGEGAVWATSGNRVVKIDPRTNRTLLEIGVVTPISLATGEGAAWVTTATERLLRIEPRTGRVASSSVLPGPAPEMVTGRGSLWLGILLQQGEIWRLSAATGEQERTVRSGGAFVGLALLGSGLWIASEDGTVSRIDPETYETLATIDVGQQPRGIAEAAGFVWICVTGPRG
jgi:YVTN family beta-propeller protein